MAKKKTYNIPNGIKENQQRWNAAKFSPRWLKLAEKVATRLCAPKAKAIYKQLEQVTGVPWFIIAVIHEREASQKWDRNIAQGDRWDRKSVRVPAGRGPFRDFKEAAIDALTNCAPYAAKWKDWSEGGALTLLLLYNGTGPELWHNTPSGYLWQGSNIYRGGKYIRDHVWDENAQDEQIGCATLLKAMMALDSDVTFGQQPGAVDEPPEDRPEKQHAEIDPDTYPDPVPLPRSDPRADEPPEPSYEDGPPPARDPYTPPAAPVDSGAIKTTIEAVGSKIGTKTVAAGTAATTTTIAAADDSWFEFISKLAHNPRFWVILLILLAFGGYLLYNCVQAYKARRK